MTEQIEKAYDDFKADKLTLSQFKNVLDTILTDNINKAVEEYNLASERFKAKKTSKEQLDLARQELEKNVVLNGGAVKRWDMTKEENPLAPGQQTCQVGFRYNPTYHEKGMFFQTVTKGMIRFGIEVAYFVFHLNPKFWTSKFIRKFYYKVLYLAIGFSRDALVEKYNEKAFVYDDNRLKEIDKFAKEYFLEYFFDYYPHKYAMMCKVLDIILGLSKEDVAYFPRLVDFYNKFAAKYGEIELLPNEKENLKQFTREAIIEKDKKKGLIWYQSEDGIWRNRIAKTQAE